MSLASLRAPLLAVSCIAWLDAHGTTKDTGSCRVPLSRKAFIATLSTFLFGGRCAILSFAGSVMQSEIRSSPSTRQVPRQSKVAGQGAARRRLQEPMRTNDPVRDQVLRAVDGVDLPGANESSLICRHTMTGRRQKQKHEETDMRRKHLTGHHISDAEKHSEFALPVYMYSSDHN